MTDQDEIKLPPLPPLKKHAWLADSQTVRDYARAAVIADRKRRAELQDTLHDLEIELARCRKERDAARAEPEKPAKPEAHRALLIMSPEGYAWMAGIVRKDCFTADIRWTDDGRAWIDNKRNRKLAKELRRLYSAGASIHCVTAADALDGGVR